MAQNQQIDRKNRQGNQRPQTPPDQQSPNQQITSAQKVDHIIRAIGQQRAEIEAGLPANVSYARFHGSIVMAMRADPSIVDCYVPSIILAALQSAYDGLMPDKREGAFIVYENNIKVGNEWFKRKEVQWTPMYRGLRKKVLKAKAIIDLQSVIIFANEQYHIQRGLNPVLEHTPILDDAARGEPIAVYSVAVYRDGGHRSFDIMTSGEIAKVKAAAKTKMVWEGPFRDEMWKKSVTRRHCKILPGGDDLIDVEAATMFPQFATPAEVEKLPRPPRPTRDQFQSLEDRSQEHVFNDFGGLNGDQREREPVEQERSSERQREGARSDSQKQTVAKSDSNEHSDQGAQQQAPTEQLAIPADAAAWESWAVGIRQEVEKAPDSRAINAMRMREQARFEAAEGTLEEELNELIFDRLAELAAGGGQGGAGPAEAEQTSSGEGSKA